MDYKRLTGIVHNESRTPWTHKNGLPGEWPLNCLYEILLYVYKLVLLHNNSLYLHYDPIADIRFDLLHYDKSSTL